MLTILALCAAMELQGCTLSATTSLLRSVLPLCLPLGVLERSMHARTCMSGTCDDARVNAQVAVIIAAAVVAQRQAEQDLDETDMSLAYSGGSGRVGHPCTCI